LNDFQIAKNMEKDPLNLKEIFFSFLKKTDSEENKKVLDEII